MLIDDFADCLNQTVTIAPFTSQNSYGDPTYGTAVTYQCRIELKNRMIRDLMGQERVARGRLYIQTQTIPSAKDQIALPSDYSPTNPEILSIYPVQSESGTDHIQIDFM